MHHDGTAEDVDKYTAMAKAVVDEQIKVFGEMLILDCGEYTFHTWNVERIRPQEQEPFDYIGPNMTPSLWLSEGFNTYYTHLLIKRSKEWDESDYLDKVAGIVNQGYQKPGRFFATTEGASQMATFTDAGASKDRTNNSNFYQAGLEKKSRKLKLKNSKQKFNLWLVQ